MKDGIRQTIGKRISGVIIAQNNREPRTQIFLTFDDDTYFEIYGNTFTGTNRIDKGSMEMLEKHLSNINANVTHRLFTNGNYPPKPSPKLKKWLARRIAAGKNVADAYDKGIYIELIPELYDPNFLEEPLRTEAIEYLAFIEPEISEE